MATVTKKEADGEHPAGHYLVVEDPQQASTWHLRVKTPDGKPDHGLMGAAWAALHEGYRGNRYEGPGKEEAIRKLKALYKDEGMDMPGMNMGDFSNQWIEIFRAGDYGAKGNWTAEDVKRVTANFEPQTWQPPLVLGHPKDDAPAMGLVRELREEAGRLLMRAEKVHPALEALVQEGRYPNRSVAFYLDPEGKGPVLRHVGFLGAQPPEIKGLEPVKFSDGEFVAIEFNEEETVDPKELSKTVAAEIRNFFSSLFGEKKPDATFTEEQVQARIAAAMKPLEQGIADLARKFDESVKQADQRTAASTEAAKKAEVAGFIEKQKAANRWVPAFDAAGLPAVLEQLALKGGTVKFGEAGKEKEAPAFELLTGFLTALPAIVPTKELVRSGKRIGKVVPFTEPTNPSTVVDAESMALAEAAQQLLPEVLKENPKLARHEAYSEAVRRAREAGASKAAGATAAGQA